MWTGTNSSTGGPGLAKMLEGVTGVTLEIASNDTDEPVVAVALSGNGVSVELPPEEQIEVILDVFDAAVATGDLSGDGPNARSAGGRQKALRNMLLASGDLIRDGLAAEACQQLVDALKRIIRDDVRAKEVTEELIGSYLYTTDCPDPDLIIRTSGEFRTSNFLLWQAAYAEYYVTPTYWPDFDKDELYEALLAYSQRDRRFGEVRVT